MQSLIEFEAHRQKVDVDVMKYGIQTLLCAASNEPFHKGHCTGENETCKLCALETILNDYYQYMKKYNGIWSFNNKKA